MCINDTDFEYQITKGLVYECRLVDDGIIGYYRTKSKITGDLISVLPNRLKPLTDIRNNKLKELLK